MKRMLDISEATSFYRDELHVNGSTYLSGREVSLYDLVKRVLTSERGMDNIVDCLADLVASNDSESTVNSLKTFLGMEIESLIKHELQEDYES